MKYFLVVFFLSRLIFLQAQDTPRSLQIYNVQFLTRDIPDYPGELLGEQTFDVESKPTIEEKKERAFVFTSEELVAAIKVNIFSDSWKHPSNTIEFSEGKLVIVQTADAHRQIDTYLKTLKSQKARLITMHFTILSLDTSTWNMISRGIKNVNLSKQKQQQIFSLVNSKREIIAMSTVTGFIGQTIHTGNIELLRYIRDYDTEIATDSVIADPEIAEIKEGYMITATAIPHNNAKRINLEVHFSLCTAKKPIEVFKLNAAYNGKIHLPEITLTKLSTTAIVINDKTAVIGSAPGKNGKTIVFLARLSTIFSPSKENNTKIKEKRELRIYDISLLINPPCDFPVPLLDDSAEQGTETGALFAGEEYQPAGIQISTEELLAMIKQNIDEDTWHNKRNSIDATHNHLIVVQTPVVLAKVEKFLEMLHRKSRNITVSAYIVSLDNKWMSQLQTSLKGHFVNQDFLDKLHRSFDSNKQIGIVGLTSVTCLNNQRVSVFRHRRQTFVADYDVEVAQSAKIADPVISHINNGISLEVQPVISDSKILLEIVLQSKNRPGKICAPMKLEAKSIGDLHLPILSEQKIRTTISTSDDKTVMLGAVSDKAGNHIVILLKANITEPK